MDLKVFIIFICLAAFVSAYESEEHAGYERDFDEESKEIKFTEDIFDEFGGNSKQNDYFGGENEWHKEKFYDGDRKQYDNYGRNEQNFGSHGYGNAEYNGKYGYDRRGYESKHGYEHGKHNYGGRRGYPGSAQII